MFLVLEMQMTDESTMSYLVTTHNTQNEAESKYHLVMSAAAVSNLYRHSASLLSEDGRVLVCGTYTHPQEEE